MSFRDFARSLRPGNDHQLAADLNTNASRQRSASHHRTGATQAAAEGQAWEAADRQREKNRRRR